MRVIAALIVLAAPAFAQHGGFFEQFFGGGGHQQHQQQQQQQNINNLVENTYIDMQCDQYLCEDTLACVPTPQDCPCLFPDSQIKCELPDGKGYVCFSSPSNDKGPDCQYVLDAYNGKA